MVFLFANIMRKHERINKRKELDQIRIRLIKMLDPHIFPEYEYEVKDMEEYRENNQKAKEFLTALYKELSGIPLEKEDEGCSLQEMYIKRYRLYEELIRQVFEEKRYTSVCSELQTAIHYHLLEQPHNLSNLLKLLGDYLEIQQD